MNSPLDSPTELEAEQPLERLLLTSPVSTTLRRELLVYRENEGGQILRIVEVISSDNGTQYHPAAVRLLDLGQDCVLPLYTIASPPRVEWNVEVVYGKGTSPVVYSLQERIDIFRLQRLFTGYEPLAYCENVTCSVIFRNPTIPLLLRDCQYKGCGEIQLWWAETNQSSPMSSVSPTSSRPSWQEASIPSINLESVRPMSFVSVQPNFHKGKELVVSAVPPPPLLVAFVQNSSWYTMLKTRITNLAYGTSQENQIDFHARNTQTFTADRLSMGEFQLNSWNLCAMGTKALGAESLKCTYLSLKFGDLMKLENFRTKLLELQMLRLELELEFARARALGPKLIPKKLSTVGAPKLPEIPQTEPIILPELGSELQARELDGNPNMGPFELISRGSRRRGNW